MKQQIPNKYFYFPIIALVIYFIIRLINQSQMISVFPIDSFANDHSSHLARLFFWSEYGFNLVPNWYNGFHLFTLYHPGWYFFTLPLFYLTKNVQSAAYLSLIIIYILAFIFVWYLGITQKLSKVKRIAFYLFFFVSPTAIGYFLRLGKYTEILGWTLFILIFAIVLYYKEHKIDKKFLLTAIPASILLLSHILVFVFVLIIFFSLFLIKKDLKERTYIAIMLLITLILTSFWLIPFLIGMQKVQISTLHALKYLISPDKKWLIDKVVAFVVPAIFLLTFYIYWRNNKPKKELLFYALPLILAFLLFTRILVYIPFFNRPIVDSYNFFFLLLTTFLLFKIEFNKTSLKYIAVLLIIIPLLGILLSAKFTPWFVPHSQDVKDTFTLLGKADEKLIVIGSKEPPAAYYAYGAIYYNTTTPDGWAPEYLTLDLKQKLNNTKIYLEQKDCENLTLTLDSLNTKEIITYNESCQTLNNCNFKEIETLNNVCLFKI